MKALYSLLYLFLLTQCVYDSYIYCFGYVCDSNEYESDNENSRNDGDNGNGNDRNNGGNDNKRNHGHHTNNRYHGHNGNNDGNRNNDDNRYYGHNNKNRNNRYNSNNKSNGHNGSNGNDGDNRNNGDCIRSCGWSEWGSWSSCNSFRCKQQQTRWRRMINCQQDDTQQYYEQDTRDCFRKRKNINSLSQEEVTKLQDAMKIALASKTNWNRYQDVAHFHGAPNDEDNCLCCDRRHSVCCPHQEPEFLPWHRLLMVNMEELLGESLPYWDWTKDEDVPDMFEGIKVPFKGSLTSLVPDRFDNRCKGTDKSSVRRGKNINIPVNQLKRNVSLAFEFDTYDEFYKHIETPHNTLHNVMRCDMRPVQTAAFDPIFYLHHVNVDRLFAFWQELQIIRNKDIQNRGLDTLLRPFSNTTINPFKRSSENTYGNETLDYKRRLCYEYDTLLFDGMTPQEFHDTLAQSRGNGNEKRFFAGVFLPKDGPSSQVQFDVCRKRGTCEFGGSVFTFGDGVNTEHYISKPVNSDNYYIAEVELEGLTAEDRYEAYAKVTMSLNISPVPPVIIERENTYPLTNDNLTITLSPETNKTDYGDLLWTRYDTYRLIPLPPILTFPN